MKLKADVYMVILLACSAGQVSSVNIHVDHIKADCEKIEREWRQKHPVRESACERMTRKKAARMLALFKETPIYWTGVDCLKR